MSCIGQWTGCCLAFSGCTTLPINPANLSQSFRNAVHPIDNDTDCKKVMRVVVEVLKVIATFCAAVGLMVTGLAVMNLSPQLGLFASLIEGVKEALPLLAGSLGGFTVATLSSIYAGTPHVPRPARADAERAGGI